jgi:hypothetical protein
VALVLLVIEKGTPMQRSPERILTTHVGSLPRPASLAAETHLGADQPDKLFLAYYVKRSTMTM